MNPYYNIIGKSYDTTRKADPYLLSRYIYLLGENKGGEYLDVGCGSGNYTSEFKKQGYAFTGIDPSEEMLSKAKAKNHNINWVQGRVEDLPFNNDHFNGAIAGLTMHHWNNVPAGLKEIHRVLKPNSNFVMFTSGIDQTAAYWLKHYFPKIIQVSSLKLPDVKFLKDEFNKIGFELVKEEKYFVKEDLQDMFLNSGKYRPALYLDKNFRAGISSFALARHQEEVQNGLTLLAKDIESGEINSIIKSYDNDLGDYLFIQVRKV